MLFHFPAEIQQTVANCKTKLSETQESTYSTDNEKVTPIIPSHDRNL